MERFKDVHTAFNGSKLMQTSAITSVGKEGHLAWGRGTQHPQPITDLIPFTTTFSCRHCRQTDQKASDRMWEETVG